MTHDNGCPKPLSRKSLLNLRPFSQSVTIGVLHSRSHLSLAHSMKNPNKQDVDPNSEFDQDKVSETGTLLGAQDPDIVRAVYQ